MAFLPLVINAAVTGMVPTKADNPAVPETPDEIARDCAVCASLGATVFHLHARDAAGRPTWRPEVYRETVVRVRQACPGAIVCVSTSGRTFKSFEGRAAVLDPHGDARPETASLSLGSMNSSHSPSSASRWPRPCSVGSTPHADGGRRGSCRRRDGGVGDAAGGGCAAPARRPPAGGARHVAALVVWGLLSAVATAVSRDAVYGITEAHAPRYAHVGSLFWVGVFGTLSVARAAPGRSRVRRWLHVGGASLLCAVVAGTAAATVQRVTGGFEELPARLSAGRECLDRRPGVDDSCLELLCPQGSRLCALASDLERRGAAFLAPDGSWRRFGRVRLVHGPAFAYGLVAVADALRFDRARAEPGWAPATRPVVVRLGRTIHWPVLEQQVPAAVRWRLRLPAAARIALQIGTLVRPGAGLRSREAADLLLEVAVAASGPAHRLAQRPRGAAAVGHEAFERLELDLTRWAGETIELAIAVHCTGVREACDGPAVVLWQYPAITPPPEPPAVPAR